MNLQRQEIYNFQKRIGYLFATSCLNFSWFFWTFCVSWSSSRLNSRISLLSLVKFCCFWLYLQHLRFWCRCYSFTNCASCLSSEGTSSTYCGRGLDPLTQYYRIWLSFVDLSFSQCWCLLLSRYYSDSSSHFPASSWILVLAWRSAWSFSRPQRSLYFRFQASQVQTHLISQEFCHDFGRPFSPSCFHCCGWTSTISSTVLHPHDSSCRCCGEIFRVCREFLLLFL